MAPLLGARLRAVLGALAACAAGAHRGDKEGDPPGQLAVDVVLDISGHFAGAGLQVAKVASLHLDRQDLAQAGRSGAVAGLHHGSQDTAERSGAVLAVRTSANEKRSGGGDACTSRLTSWEAVDAARRAAGSGAFACYDLDNGGDLSKEEQEELIKDLDSIGLPGKDIVKEADKNRDGHLQLEEFQAILLDFTQRCLYPLNNWALYPNATKYPGASFTCYDKAGDILLASGRGGGDGRIDGVEMAVLTAHLSLLGLPAEAYVARADTNFLTMDRDNELTFQEFKSLIDLCMGCGGLTSKEAIHEAAALPGISFVCYDWSHDGALEESEQWLLKIDLTSLGYGAELAKGDADGDKRLDFAEYAALARRLDAA